MLRITKKQPIITALIISELLLLSTSLGDDTHHSVVDCPHGTTVPVAIRCAMDAFPMAFASTVTLASFDRATRWIRTSV